MVALAVGSGAAPVVVGLLLRQVVNELVSHQATFEILIIIAAGITAATMAASWAPTVIAYELAVLRRATTLSMQGRLFASVAQNPGIRSFEDPSAMDRLRLAQDAGESAPSQAMQSTITVIGGLVTLVGFLTSLALIQPVLAAIIGVASIPDLAIQISLGRMRLLAQSKTAAHIRRRLFYTMLQADEPAAREVRLFGFWRYIHSRMQAELAAINSLELAVEWRQLVSELLSGSAGVLVAGAGLVLAIFWVVHGVLSVGDIALYLSAVAGTQGSLSGIMQAIGQMIEATGGFGNYERCLAAPPDVSVSPQPLALPPLTSGLTFDDVWFRYADNLPWTLLGVNFDIPARTAVALVGKNGAGKSTILKLLCRFYDPTRGRILWDGTDIREFDVAMLRSRMSAVFQDFMCYDLTLSENIGVGDVGRIDRPSEIRAAGTTAGLEGVVKRLPEGYDTMLSRIFITADEAKVGTRLSGGEWQRVALARALLRSDVQVVMLDEPSAGLDATSEEALHARLVDVNREHATLLVTHRMGAAQRAQRIIVLDMGRVTEIGTHADLIGRSQVYSELFRAQAAPFLGSDQNPTGLQGREMEARASGGSLVQE